MQNENDQTGTAIRSSIKKKKKLIPWHMLICNKCTEEIQGMVPVVNPTTKSKVSKILDAILICHGYIKQE